MYLESFDIKNFRSFKSASVILSGKYSVIVGPNNEGKSNILQALDICFNQLLSFPQSRLRPRLKLRHRRTFNRRHNTRLHYDWERDFPQDIQQENVKKGSKITEFRLKFKLDDNDKKLIKKSTLPMRETVIYHVKFLNKEYSKIQISYDEKKEKLTKELEVDIYNFLKERIEFLYIPTIRTSEQIEDVVQLLFEKELETLKESSKYKQAVKKIIDLQRPILKRLSNELLEIVRDFIPEVKHIDLETDYETRGMISHFLEILIDDGVKTDLELKGDGIKDLIAISLLKGRKETSKKSTKDLLIALEEPESHLHPKAIQKLKRIFLEISQKNQLIISTHSPILVERLIVQNNIIVHQNKINLANNIQDIRKSLGVGLSDNLSSGFLVLLVEGECDKNLLKNWLTDSSLKIKKSIENSVLIIDDLGGGANLGYKASFYKSQLCNIYAFLDNDAQAKCSIQKALDDEHLNDSEYMLCTISDKKHESELEDLISVNVYAEMIKKKFGVHLDVKAEEFKEYTKKKWSDRMESYFTSKGKVWFDKTKKDLKREVCQMATEVGIKSLDNKHGNIFNELVDRLNSILENSKNK